MADSFIQVAPDGAGKKMQTVVNTIGADSVHAEAVLLVGPDGLPLVTIPVSGGLTNAELRASPVKSLLTNPAGSPLGMLSDILQTSVMAEIFGSPGSLQILSVDGVSSGLLVKVVNSLEIAGAKPEDSPSANADLGFPMLAIRKAIPSNTSDTDGDYEMLQMSGGKLWTLAQASLADGADITQGQTTGAAVITDANGTLQQYLRGLVKLWAAGPPLTDAALRATPVPVSGTVATGGLTDTQLRATAVPVSGPLTDAQLRATAVPVSGPLTDARFDATRNLLPTAGQKLAVATYSPSQFKNLGANATLNVKASAGNVFSLSCYNANAAARYLQLHNTATTPAGSAVPVFSFLVPPSSQIIIGSDYFTNEGCNFATGIAFGFSTARDIYTAGTAGDQSTWIQYK